MTRPRATTSAIDELGAIIADLKSRLVKVEQVAHAHGTVGTDYVRRSGDTMTGALTISGANLTVTAPGLITGNGSGLTTLNASNLSSGTVASARISGSYTGITGVGTLAAGSISSGFGNIDIGTSTFTGNGSGLTTLNASNLSSGTVASARISGSYTGITGTGALNAGSITSGFGAINNGTSGATMAGTVTIGGTSQYLRIRDTTDNSHYLEFRTSLSANRTATFPNASGTVITTGNLGNITSTGTLSSLSVSGTSTLTGRVALDGGADTAYTTSTTTAALFVNRNVNATGSYSDYHYGRTNAVFRNNNSARAAVNSFWTTSSTDLAVTYGIWSGEPSRFRVTNMINNGMAFVNAAGFTVVSSQYTKERIRSARDENGDGLVDVCPATCNAAFSRFQQLRPVIYNDLVKSLEGVWLGCDEHTDRRQCEDARCPNFYNTEVREHECDASDCGGTNENPCPVYLEHYDRLHFIAEEVDDIYPHAVSKRPDGSAVGIDHHVLATEHINVTQHLIDAVMELQSRVSTLEAN